MWAIGLFASLLVVVSAIPQTSVLTKDGVQLHLNSPLISRNATGRVIPVVVGGPQAIYMPNVVTAAVGDTIQFQFATGNHTVTQSSEMQACAPIQRAALAAGAVPIHSGHIPFVAGSQMVSTFEMNVTSTKPMFMYCSTGVHCQVGQVMVINPTSVGQVVAYARRSQATNMSIDGTAVAGGTVGKIPLLNAAFDPPR